MKSEHYNLHNLVSINFFFNDTENVDYFRRRFSHFRSSKAKIADINVYFNVWPEKYNHEILQKLEKSTVLHDKSRRRLGKWDAYIIRGEENRTDIIFCGNKPSQKYLFFNFLEPILNYTLFSKGCCLVHASCFSIGGKGYVIHGFPSSGKTSILLRMLQLKADYLSDEMTILSETGNVYCYPTPLCFPDYTFKKGIPSDLSFIQIIKKYLFRLIRILSRNKIKLTMAIPPAKVLKGGKIIDTGKLDIACLIDPQSSFDVSEDHKRKTLLRINQCQYRYFKDVLDIHIRKYGESELADYWERMSDIIGGFCDKINPVILNNQSEFETKAAIGADSNPDEKAKSMNTLHM